MSHNNNSVIFIVGPTASGKTGLSVKLAEHFGSEIVSADSMQIYRGMHIASAAPDEDEKRGIPHHLFEFLDGNEKFSVSHYVKYAEETLREICARNKTPIVVGGTGLYVSALSRGVDFGEEDNNGEIRNRLELECEEKGIAALYEQLKKIDPAAAEKISYGDKKRVLRALEIFYLSGKTKTERDELSLKKGKQFNDIIIGLTFSDRQTLYDRINKRVDIMLQNGLLEEAREAFGRVNGTAAQAIGHKEFFPYFLGEISLEQAIERLKMQTRRYAKRQLTWFKKTEGIHWLNMDDPDRAYSEAVKLIEQFVK